MNNQGGQTNPKLNLLPTTSILRPISKPSLFHTTTSSLLPHNSENINVNQYLNNNLTTLPNNSALSRTHYPSLSHSLLDDIDHPISLSPIPQKASNNQKSLLTVSQTSSNFPPPSRLHTARASSTAAPALLNIAPRGIDSQQPAKVSLNKVTKTSLGTNNTANTTKPIAATNLPSKVSPHTLNSAANSKTLIKASTHEPPQKRETQQRYSGEGSDPFEPGRDDDENEHDGKDRAFFHPPYSSNQTDSSSNTSINTINNTQFTNPFTNTYSNNTRSTTTPFKAPNQPIPHRAMFSPMQQPPTTTLASRTQPNNYIVIEDDDPFLIEDDIVSIPPSNTDASPNPSFKSRHQQQQPFNLNKPSSHLPSLPKPLPNPSATNPPQLQHPLQQIQQQIHHHHQQQQQQQPQTPIDLTAPHIPHISQAINNIPLRPISSLPASERAPFPYSTFNSVQSQCFPTIYHSQENVTISAPTGGGKTVLFELALLAMFHDKNHPNRQLAQKAVYIAPLRALCDEKLREWTEKFGNTVPQAQSVFKPQNQPNQANPQPLGLKFQLYTGTALSSDSDSMRSLYEADVIITTPEKLNALTQRWKSSAQCQRLLNSVRLLCIDEVHTLNDGIRGATLEGCITRFKFMQESVKAIYNAKNNNNNNNNNQLTSTTTSTATTSTMTSTSMASTSANQIQQMNSNTQDIPPIASLRIIAVSATIPNLTDIQRWIGGKSFQFGDAFRPIDIEKIIIPYPDSTYGSSYSRPTPAQPAQPAQTQSQAQKQPKPKAGNDWKFLNSLNYKLYALLATYSEGRPALIFNATRKECLPASQQLLQDARKALRDNSPFVATQIQHNALNQGASRIKDKAIADLVRMGVGIHHAGMDHQDLHEIEQLFLAGHLKVVNTTSTLSQGVNLPAYLVIIKGTSVYSSRDKGYIEMPKSHILQATGRAGRPGLETSGRAIIMTKQSTYQMYQSLDMLPIESHLSPNLIEHLTAEIAINSITTIDDIKKWVRHTFLYVRATGLSAFDTVDIVSPSRQVYTASQQQPQSTSRQITTTTSSLSQTSLDKLNQLLSTVAEAFLRLYDANCIIISPPERYKHYRGPPKAQSTSSTTSTSLRTSSTSVSSTNDQQYNPRTNFFGITVKNLFTHPYLQYFIFPTHLCTILSSNSLKFTSVHTLQQLPTVFSMEQLIDLISTSPEFEDSITIRQGDKGLLVEINKNAKEYIKYAKSTENATNLNKKSRTSTNPTTTTNEDNTTDANTMTYSKYKPMHTFEQSFHDYGFRYPLSRSTVKDVSDKIKILFQAGLDIVNVKLTSLDLTRDRDEIIQTSMRLLNAFIEYSFHHRQILIQLKAKEEFLNKQDQNTHDDMTGNNDTNQFELNTLNTCYFVLKYSLYLRKSCERKLWAISTAQSNTILVNQASGKSVMQFKEMVQSLCHCQQIPQNQQNQRNQNGQQQRCICIYEPMGIFSQLDGIGPVLNTKLGNAGLTTFSQLAMPLAFNIHQSNQSNQQSVNQNSHQLSNTPHNRLVRTTTAEFERCGISKALATKALQTLRTIPVLSLNVEWLQSNPNPRQHSQSFPSYACNLNLHQNRTDYIAKLVANRTSNKHSFSAANSAVFVLVGIPETNTILYSSPTLFGLKLRENQTIYQLLRNLQLPSGYDIVIDVLLPRGMVGCDLSMSFTVPGVKEQGQKIGKIVEANENSTVLTIPKDSARDSEDSAKDNEYLNTDEVSDVENDPANKNRAGSTPSRPNTTNMYNQKPNIWKNDLESSSASELAKKSIYSRHNQQQTNTITHTASSPKDRLVEISKRQKVSSDARNDVDEDWFALNQPNQTMRSSTTNPKDARTNPSTTTMATTTTTAIPQNHAKESLYSKKPPPIATTNSNSFSTSSSNPQSTSIQSKGSLYTRKPVATAQPLHPMNHAAQPTSAQHTDQSTSFAADPVNQSQPTASNTQIQRQHQLPPKPKAATGSKCKPITFSTIPDNPTGPIFDILSKAAEKIDEDSQTSKSTWFDMDDEEDVISLDNSAQSTQNPSQQHKPSPTAPNWLNNKSTTNSSITNDAQILNHTTPAPQFASLPPLPRPGLLASLYQPQQRLGENPTTTKRLPLKRGLSGLNSLQLMSQYKQASTPVNPPSTTDGFQRSSQYNHNPSQLPFSGQLDQFPSQSQPTNGMSYNGVVGNNNMQLPYPNMNNALHPTDLSSNRPNHYNYQNQHDNINTIASNPVTFDDPSANTEQHHPNQQHDVPPQSNNRFQQLNATTAISRFTNNMNTRNQLFTQQQQQQFPPHQSQQHFGHQGQYMMPSSIGMASHHQSDQFAPNSNSGGFDTVNFDAGFNPTYPYHPSANHLQYNHSFQPSDNQDQCQPPSINPIQPGLYNLFPNSMPQSYPAPQQFSSAMNNAHYRPF